ncbi:hypothetical protein [Deinococcus multiflagellatus]|uniref:Uncharacterized protein n=1 Tax=Deinococcus multiflagellatus TaxID=1656887 RepID=A0ABW1ZEY9_9DEIO|nr:hypothetical protein [Deinococcus multiflagellatus]MBZ9712168.1 hypothetical protein [Deinococcus multiflagellatus]
MTKTYTVSPRSEATFTEPFTVRAESYDEAATKASRKLNGRTTRGLRVTGTSGMSGVFQGYKSVRGGGETSVGGNFHLSEQ